MSQDRNTEHQKTASADAALDALFSEAQLAPPEPLPDGLRSRLMADALAATTPAAAPRRSWLARFGAVLADLGGASGLAGVSAAGVAGVWIGFSGPGVTGDLVTQFWQGAATVSPTVSTWVEAGPLASSDITLLSYMNGEGE